MTKARLGHMLLMQNIARVRGWPASKAVCVMCKSVVEDVTHFLLHCKVLAPCRERFVRSLAASLESAGLPGRFVLQRVQQGGDACLGVMLGGVTKWPCSSGLDEASFRANCGKASWLACVTAKNKTGAHGEVVRKMVSEPPGRGIETRLGDGSFHLFRESS